MTFENNKAIYEQMADRLCDEIIALLFSKVIIFYPFINTLLYVNPPIVDNLQACV